MPPAEGDSHTCRPHIHFTSLGHPTVSPLNILNSSSSKTSCHRLTSRRPEAHINTPHAIASETFSSHLGSTSLLPSPHTEIPSWQVGCSNSAQTEMAQTGCGGEQADVTRVVEEGGQTGGYGKTKCA